MIDGVTLGTMSLMFYLAYYSFIVGSIIQIGYWSLLFSRLAFFKIKKPSKATQKPVSVVICAKNEAKNLQQYLPKILQQKYPNFGIIRNKLIFFSSNSV